MREAGTSLLVLAIVLEVQPLQQGKEKKTNIRKKEVKLSLFVGDMIEEKILMNLQKSTRANK